MSRTWAALSFAVLILVSCGDSEPSAPLGQYQSVSEMVSVLKEDGIACENLNVKNKEELKAEREAEHEHTPPPGAVPIKGPQFDVYETGFCQFEGSPEVAGKQLASTLTIYENDEHLKSIPDQGFPGLALIYGDNWEVQLTNIKLTQDIADSLGGKVVPPLKALFEESDVAAVGPHCFFLAALPPGLERAAEQMGISAADPDEFARAFGESLYYLSDEVQKSVEENCRKGLEMESAVRVDEDILRTKEFEEFWMSVCSYSPNDQLITQELGFAEGFSYKELGFALTDRFLKPTSLKSTEIRDLERRCGAAVKKGAIGGLG